MLGFRARRIEYCMQWSCAKVRNVEAELRAAVFRDFPSDAF